MLIKLYQPSACPLDEGIGDAVVWRSTRAGKWSESIRVSTSVRLSFTQGHPRHLHKIMPDRAVHAFGICCFNDTGAARPALTAIELLILWLLRRFGSSVGL